MLTRYERSTASWVIVAALLLSGIFGLAAAYAIDYLVGPGGPPPIKRLYAAAFWGLGWTGLTGGWWLTTFYNSSGAIFGLYHPWPRFAGVALLAGWAFWGAALSAAIPSARRWREGKRAGGAPNPARPAPPPTAAQAEAVRKRLVIPTHGTLIGVSEGCAAVILTDAQANHHVMVIGATGSGKSTALRNLIASAVARGHAVLVIDGKGSDELRRRVQDIAAKHGRDFRAFTFRGGHHWNPCKHGDPTHLRDTVASLWRSENLYYQSITTHWLGTITQALAAAGVSATLRGLKELSNPDFKALDALLRRIPDSALSDRLRAPFLHPDEGTKSGIAGVGHRLGRLTETPVGSGLEPADDPALELDLLECATADGGPIGYFSLDSMQYPEAARDVGALVMQELQAVASELLARGNTRPVYLVIDEFSAFQTDQILTLLNKGRESGLHCVLATQDLADLERTGGRTAVAQIVANTAIKLVLRIDSRQTAEMLASTLGTRPGWQKQHRTAGGAATGEATARMEEQAWLDPSVLMQQSPGEATLICKAPEISVRRVRLFKAD